jgi:glycerophosphoryl diester phosphodiesterase
VHAAFCNPEAIASGHGADRARLALDWCAMSYRTGKRPRVMGHRGAAGVAPENTLVSFQAAVDAGADVLEMDVHATRDGRVVVLHDPTVDRTTDGTGEVRGLTWEELQRLDASAGFSPLAGETAVPFTGPLRVPLFDEVLEAFPDALINVEIKQGEPALEEAVLAVIDRHRARPRVLLAAEHAVIARRIRAAAPDVLGGMSAEDVYGFLTALDDPAYAAPAFALQVPATYGDMVIVSEATVARAHALGMEVHVWTVDDPAEMTRLLDLGVDGLITNVPHRAVAVVRARLAHMN